MRNLFLGLLGAVLTLASGATGAQAVDKEPLQARVDAIVAIHGGVQTAPNQVEWDGGDVTLTLELPGIAPLSVGSCATGKFCAYGGANLTGSKLSFTTCDTTHSTEILGLVRSMANARSSGTVQGLSNAGTVLTSIGAGGQVNSAPTGIKKAKCIS